MINTSSMQLHQWHLCHILNYILLIAYMLSSHFSNALKEQDDIN